MRYANWLHNGKPLATAPVTTEDGAYRFSDGDLDGGRRPGGLYYVPTRDEWYKAAYYDPDSDSYRDQPTDSDPVPTAAVPGRDVGNHINASGARPVEDPLTDVGAYRFSASPSGTLDQGGNVVEWLEDSLELHGGHWNLPADRSGRQANPVNLGDANVEENFLGFRLVPEPGASTLGGAALIALMLLRRRRAVAR